VHAEIHDMLSLGMLIEAPAEPGLNVLKEIVFMAHHLGLTGMQEIPIPSSKEKKKKAAATVLSPEVHQKQSYSHRQNTCLGQ
jgi:hypothetical protein